MVNTRAQQDAEEPAKAGTKREEPEPEPEHKSEDDPANEEHEPAAKKTREDGDQDVAKYGSTAASTEDLKVQKLLNDYGSFPFMDTSLADPYEPTSQTLLAHLLNALLTSARISHKLATRTVRTVIEAGWADIEVLEKTSWEQRTKVLTEGGYARYREKTATEFGELVEFLRDKYEGDLNNVLKSARDSVGQSSDKLREEVKRLAKEVKGLGDVGVEIFCDTVQGVWHEICPFLDARSLKSCEDIGLPADAAELFELVGRDPVKMCRLAQGLAFMRLQKAERDVEEADGDGEEN